MNTVIYLISRSQGGGAVQHKTHTAQQQINEFTHLSIALHLAINAAFFQILTIALLCGTSHQLRLYKKLKRFKNVPLDFYTMITFPLMATYF